MFIVLASNSAGKRWGYPRDRGCMSGCVNKHKYYQNKTQHYPHNKQTGTFEVFHP